jgi:hypothetical protein
MVVLLGCIYNCADEKLFLVFQERVYLDVLAIFSIVRWRQSQHVEIIRTQINLGPALSTLVQQSLKRLCEETHLLMSVFGTTSLLVREISK